MLAADVAPPAWVVRAPSGGLKATLQSHSGRLRLYVGRTGLRADLGPAPRRLRVRRGRLRARFTTPAGKRHVHRVTGRTLTVGRVKLLVARDGVAFKAPRATWHLPRSRAWLQRYTGAYEEPYRKTRASGRYAFPALVRSRRRFTLLTESGVGRGAVGHLRRDGRRLRVEPADGLWQVAVTGSLADVVESDLPLALGRPSRVRDTSWIHPGRAAWSWLDDHASPGHADAQRAAIDAAAQAGWEYVTVDAGWHAEDVPGLVAYAADRGVRLILWFDVAGISPAVLDRVAGWGVAGVKVDYFYNDRRLRIRQMDDVARWAAARRLVIDFHGCTIPRGLQRTWPNVLSLEAVRGEEHAPLAARDVVNLAFTRNAVGSMDFTPRGDPAQAIVFESGLQHYAHGGPLLDEIPADWDDTRLLSGAPDDHVVIARRDGTRWFVGGLFARPRRLAVRLPRGRYRARFADGTQRDVSGTLTVAGDFAAILTPYDAAHGT